MPLFTVACCPGGVLLSRGCSEALWLVTERGSACWEEWSAQQWRGADICALLRLSPSQQGPVATSPCLPPLVPCDRGVAWAAGVRDSCQQGDHVSSESVPCMSHGHVDWQPASADYHHCGNKRNPLWLWQAYELQDMLILSNQHFIQRLRLCYLSLENTLPGRYSDTLAICLRLKDQIITTVINCISSRTRCLCVCTL